MNDIIKTISKATSPVTLALLSLSVLVLSGCASTATSPENPEDILISRAESRWEALLSNDYETAYSYYSPGFRSGTSVVNYAIGIRSRKVRWTSAEYKEHSCTENSCKLTFDVGYRVLKPVPGLDKWDGTNLIEETWINTGGEWWYMDKKK